DVYPASGLALAAAYHDIKTRLASLERENSSIKRKLKHYEVKFPMISEFGEERILCCSCDPIINDTSVIQSETTNLQQRVNSLTQELQKSKEREERLEEVIQAYEKIHLEKSNVQRDLDKMTTLAEQHMERICSLESALRQRETSLQKLSAQLRSKDAHQSQVHASLDVPREEEGRGPTLQSSRSLDALSDLKLQRLEAELEGARMAEGACQRENELRAELQRLQQEVAQLQDAQSQSQDLPAHCEHCDVEWIKKAGDEQVNLALAYTELTEELGRVRDLAIKQSDLLRQGSQEPGRAKMSDLDGRHSPQPSVSEVMSQGFPLFPLQFLVRIPPRSDSPRPPRSEPPSPLTGSSPPPLLLCPPPLLAPPPTPTSRPARLRAKFQGRRSYSEVSDPSAIQRAPARLKRDPVSTLPKPRSLLGEMHGYGQTKAQLRTSIVGLVRPASAQEHSIRPSFPSPRKQPHHPSFSAPEGPATLSCHLPPYMNTEHAQSWPSINLWMESEESAIRSCPLCQLTFPTGYPDDALIKHIDSHLENSKI
uniref:TBK1 binding protein 1 n=1 Tax=Tetraodon nigroviridis TaxID=99883 RepID=H3CZR8_TETNG